MKRSTFHIPGMCCPSEEQLIRVRLQHVERIEHLQFDFLARELTVTHLLDDEREILTALETLGMNARLKAEPPPADVRVSVFYLAKMDCPTEERLVRGRLQGMPGIERLDFNLMERELVVAHLLPDEKPILAALNSLGMEPVLRDPASVTDRAMQSRSASDAAATHPTWFPLALSGILAAVAEGVAWVSGNEASPPVITLALLSIGIGGRDTLRKGLVAVRNRTLNINFLMTLAVFGAAVIGQWPEAAMVLFLFSLAEMIEGYSLERARNAVRALMALTPETATVRTEDGQWMDVNAAGVAVGQVVRVRPGERIPLDGTVTEGRSTVNQAPITGESMPVEKSPGETVFAGTVNERGSLEFEVTANQGDTTLARIIRAIQEAQAQRAPTQRFIDRFAAVYTPAVVLLAFLVAAVPPLFFGQPGLDWIYRALVLLVIACPCALVISTPVTVVSGLAAAARNGILVKGGLFLEEGRRLRVIALDKTGTLTHGRPELTDVVPLGDRAPEELLHWAASLNSLSEHPVASAIVARCALSHGDSPCVLFPVTEFEAIVGRGVRGRIHGRMHYVGNHRLVEENRVCSARVEEALDRLEEVGKTAVVLTDEATPLAVLGVADTLRETSVEAVRELHSLGLRTVMLTGDNPTTARAIADQAGIDDARGSLLPEDKLAAVEDLRNRYGHVGMVGDGINDAPALARASIGFAMGAAGTDTALETADVALMEDDLRKLPVFIRLSRATNQVLIQNITLAIGIKVFFFALALTGQATLWMAVFADMGASLLVVFNGLRLLRFGARRETPPPAPAPAATCGHGCAHD